MTNMNVINRATELVIDYCEAIGAAVDNDAERNVIESWYDNTDFTDPYVLAVYALEYGFYNRYGFYEMNEIAMVQNYFPNCVMSARGFQPNPACEDDIPIWEIEEAERY